jgi:site-specific DNA-methyltransferase (adenine-specific)
VSQASFTLQGHNPDVLTCIANLSNDEVFTPPEFANLMLDTLENSWAESNGGENIWSNKSVTFLDPCTKSGVFLREIVKRLNVGLANEIPDLTERVNHILTKQIFGIGVTQLTSLLARRSVYCSKYANGIHSVARTFANDSGNVWFERTEHTWIKGKCKFCGASEAEYGRSEDRETYAYAFIHCHKIRDFVSEIFGKDMHFDVIIGNPPYQLGSDGGTRDVPIYQKFVEQAMALEPRFLSMVIPARWMAGGLGLGEFRSSMLSDRQIRVINDYPISKDVFPSVEVKGGICVFLWKHGDPGTCQVTTRRGAEQVGPVSRRLDEFDVFVRDANALGILDKVLAQQEPSMQDILSARTAFGVVSNFSGYFDKPGQGRVRYYATSPKGRVEAWIDRSKATINTEAIDQWKAMIPEAGSDGGQKIPDSVLGKPWIAQPPSICTQSFLFVCVDDEPSAKSVCSYYRTKFLRFLVSLRKITQHTTAQSYLWVPQQSWDRTWTDVALYKKYKFTKDEIAFIESQIREMESGDE